MQVRMDICRTEERQAYERQSELVGGERDCRGDRPGVQDMRRADRKRRGIHRAKNSTGKDR